MTQFSLGGCFARTQPSAGSRINPQADFGVHVSQYRTPPSDLDANKRLSKNANRTLILYHFNSYKTQAY